MASSINYRLPTLRQSATRPPVPSGRAFPVFVFFAVRLKEFVTGFPSFLVDLCSGYRRARERLVHQIEPLFFDDFVEVEQLAFDAVGFLYWRLRTHPRIDDHPCLTRLVGLTPSSAGSSPSGSQSSPHFGYGSVRTTAPRSNFQAPLPMTCGGSSQYHRRNLMRCFQMSANHEYRDDCGAIEAQSFCILHGFPILLLVKLIPCRRVRTC